MDLKNMLTGVAERLSSLREERPSAGTGYRLMAMTADIAEVIETLSREVLERVRQEPVLDADVDIDFDVMAEEVLSWELTMADGNLQELTGQVNDALGRLSETLSQINTQLGRRHKDEAYAHLYEQEKHRYLSSKTIRRLRQAVEDWLYDVCNGAPTLEEINDYVIEKLVHMFEKGVFNSKVEHLQRATRYSGEFDFSLLDDDHRLKKTIHKHYSEFRKLVASFLHEPQGGECQGPSQRLPEVHVQDLAGAGGIREVADRPDRRRGQQSAARRAGYRLGDEVLAQIAAGRLRRRT